jgi:lysozyme family protein
MEWELYITYGLTPYKLRAVLEYNSNQIMRIRVYGASSSLLLENDYPAIQFNKSKRGIKWKIREGAIKAGNAKSSRLLQQIMVQLEKLIKKDFAYRMI